MAVAKVVIQTKQHLAVLIPCGPALVLNLLRWGGEIRSWEDLKLPPVGAKAAGLKESEMAMAKELVKGMTAHWSADKFRDSFRESIMKLAEQKAKAGQTKAVEKLEAVEESPRKGADVIDLTELLKRSLGRGAKQAEPADEDDKTGAAAAKKSTQKSTQKVTSIKKAAASRKSAASGSKQRRAA